MIGPWLFTRLLWPNREPYYSMPNCHVDQLIPKHGSSTLTVRLEQTRGTNNIFFAISPSTFVIASKPDRDKLMCIFFSSLRYGPKLQICETTNERKIAVIHALRRLINKPFYFRSKSPTGFTLMSMSPTKRRPTRISPGSGSVGSGSLQNTCSDTSGSWG